jgi:mannose-6-phosphate isomerase
MAMTATQLVTRRVEKLWGRRDLPPAFGAVPDDEEPVGEIWFEHPDGRQPELLIKYLFTAEKLSIQVHPDDESARARGERSGKDEAWLVLAADPGATIGIGLTEEVDREELRAAALEGRIEQLLDLRPARAGDNYYSPAGTVHALGPGLTLVEVQQNVDLTYRLYDYGRPRELHLDEAVAVADPAPYVAPFEAYEMSNGREILADCPAFVLERWRGAASGMLQAEEGRPVWVVPVEGSGGRIAGDPLEPGTAWLAEGPVELRFPSGSDTLIAYPGKGVRKDLLV